MTNFLQLLINLLYNTTSTYHRLFRIFITFSILAISFSEIISNSFKYYTKNKNGNKENYKKVTYDFVSTFLSGGMLFTTAYNGFYKANIIKYTTFGSVLFGSCVVIYALKIFYKKTRPDSSSQDSFPSGHVAFVAISIIYWALFYYNYYNHSWSYSLVLRYILLLVILFIIAKLRIMAERHDIVDVFGAIFISVFLYIVCFLIELSYLKK